MGILHSFFAKLHKNGWLFFITLGVISFCVSVVGFVTLSKSGFEVWMFVQALTLSFADMPSDENGWIVSGKVLWMLTFTSAAFSLFLRDWSHKQLFKAIVEKEAHYAIIGLGKLSHNYIYELPKESTVIYNNNKSISSALYEENGYAIKDAELSEICQSLNIANMQKCLINTGEDRDNIELVFEIIQKYIHGDLSNPLRLIVRIENRELNALFLSNKIFTDSEFKETKIELKTYSFFEECAIKLFEDNFIDGDDDTLIKSDEAYSMVIVGDGKLANKIVYEAAKIAHLPNENVLNIYLVSNDPQTFKNSLIKSYPNIEKIPTLKLIEKKMDYKTLDFYQDALWDMQNTTNVILCYDDEDTNIEIASSMQDKTYLRKQNITTKILFGVFNQRYISELLDLDDKAFKIFKSFGDAKSILSQKNIFDDENYLLAKLINYTYDGLVQNDKYNADAIFHYDLNREKIDSKWFKTFYSDKASSIAQAKHISMKLKTLGLSYEKSARGVEELLKINRAAIDSKFDVAFQGAYPFPQNFTQRLFDKMLRLEHNRWNAFHYLNGWKYAPLKNKPAKEHDCLLPIQEFPAHFEDKRLTDLIEWDIYSFMYMPNYLAEAGYEIVKFKINKKETK